MGITVGCNDFKDSIVDGQQGNIEGIIDEKIKWLENNAEADAEDFKRQKKDAEDVVQPIIAKLYQGAGGSQSSKDEEADDSSKDEL